MPYLNWIGRDAVINHDREVPYRLLEYEAGEEYGDSGSENLVVHGDNLEALKALLPRYQAEVQCIYIDPPYNTGTEDWVYNDNVDSPTIRKWLGKVVGGEMEDLSRHDKWLCMMYPRLKLLKRFLKDTGVLWMHLDDNEAHYGKVILDELFGRENFVAHVVWQKRTSPDARKTISHGHDHILVYAKNWREFKTVANQVSMTPRQASEYSNPDNDPRGPWVHRDLTGQAGHATPDQFYTITTPAGKSFTPPDGRCWALTEASYKELEADGRIWFGAKGTAKPRVKKYLSEADKVAPWTWWTNKETGNTQEAKKEILSIFGKPLFETPKPERLIHRVLEISTNPGDLVLDSFAGSGTTGAVAHKMGRRWIMVELEEHYKDTIVPRLQKVIDGHQVGMSEDLEWAGGGGFKVATLGPTMLDVEDFLNEEVTYEDLASHVFLTEFGRPLGAPEKPPLVARTENEALYVLFNGVLGDKRPDGGNILTEEVLDMLPGFDPDLTNIVYGEASLLDEAELAAMGVRFKQLPHDLEEI